MLAFAKFFGAERGGEIEWTVFRLPMLLGGRHEVAMKQDRDKEKGMWVWELSALSR